VSEELALTPEEYAAFVKNITTRAGYSRNRLHMALHNLNELFEDMKDKFEAEKPLSEDTLARELNQFSDYMSKVQQDWQDFDAVWKEICSNLERVEIA